MFWMILTQIGKITIRKCMQQFKKIIFLCRWTGYNDRGEGLFPANFVTADLNAEISEVETNRYNDNKTTSNNTSVENRERQQNTEEIQISIDEMKIDRLLHLLHDANPEDPSQV